MKISYITSSRIPAERAYGYAIVKLCSEWATLGHEVELLVPERKFGPQETPFEYYNIPENFAFRKIRTSDFLGKRLATSKTPFVLDLLSFIWSLKKEQLKDRVLYTREYLLALILPSKNLFIELHSIPNRTWLFKRALARVKGIVVISAGLRSALQSLGIPNDRILVAHDGVDLDAFEHTVADRNVWNSLGIIPSKKIVLYTGHLYEWKGADTLGAAAALVPEAQFVFIGGVDTELEAFRNTFTSSNITVVPHIRREEIPKYLKSADVLVLPHSGKYAISREYSSPLKLFEYMASGLPIVASDVPSVREILDEKNAFWFTPDTPESCAAAVTSALDNAVLAQAKAANAREVVTKYTWSARAAAIAGYIQ